MKLPRIMGFYELTDDAVGRLAMFAFAFLTIVAVITIIWLVATSA